METFITTMAASALLVVRAMLYRATGTCIIYSIDCLQINLKSKKNNNNNVGLNWVHK